MAGRWAKISQEVNHTSLFKKSKTQEAEVGKQEDQQKSLTSALERRSLKKAKQREIFGPIK